MKQKHRHYRQDDVSAILTREQGIRYGKKACTIALGYPAPYAVGTSSLGFQTIYRLFNETGFIGCERFFLSSTRHAPRTLESRLPINQADAIAFSISCETELLGICRLLSAAGLSPLADRRHADDPVVIVGGPLTLLDPRLVAPLADIVVCGEGEESVPPLSFAIMNHGSKASIMAACANSGGGIWIPDRDPSPPGCHQVSSDHLPAFATNWSSLAGLKGLFLIEIARGCPHHCQFCVLASCRRFRRVAATTLLERIPPSADRVGLVGAAVTDHPELVDIVRALVRNGKRVSLSSLRADRLSEPLLTELIRGGLRTLTVAADGASDSLRSAICKGITADHLLAAAHMARHHKLKGLKVYSMVGLPGETDADIEELARLLNTMAQLLPIQVAVQSFVPKPGTPLADALMLSTEKLKHRIALLRTLSGAGVSFSATSPKWSRIDWKLAHGGMVSPSIAMDADTGGGTFAAWRRAISTHLKWEDDASLLT